MKKIDNKGITLIALVITIVLMLVIAGISINLAFGENGILNKSTSIRDDAKEAKAQEELNIIISGYYTGKGKGTITISLEEYLEKYGIENYTDNGDGTYTIKYNGFAFTYNKNKGIKPEFEIEQKLASDEQTMQVIVTITNADSLQTIEALVKDSNGNEIESTIAEDNTTITFTAQGNGTYTLDMETTIIIDGDILSESDNTTIEIAGIYVPITTTYGSIDIIWIDNENNVVNFPNAPILSGMTAIKWDEEYNEIETSEADLDWYSYTAGTGTADNTYSKWANAKNSDGSYFVWIPRYAYRITYYSDSAKTTVTGYYDGNGLRKVDGNLKYKLDDGIETVEHNGYSYIVHPAFENNVDQGGWDSDLAGIWVAKFNMSMEENGVTINTTSADGANDKNGNATIAGNVAISETIKAVSKPNVSPWGYIWWDTSYNNALSYDTTKNSHLIKNSEYGAVFYLTHSQYGRNGNQTYQSYHTTTGSAYVSSTAYAYNTERGMGASSTGNIYGIYDVNPNGEYAWLAAKNEGESSKYSTKYKAASDNTEKSLYEIGKIGDATKEIYVKTTSSSIYLWFSTSIENITLTDSAKVARMYIAQIFLPETYKSTYLSALGAYFSYRVVLAPQ